MPDEDANEACVHVEDLKKLSQDSGVPQRVDFFAFAI